MYIIKCEIEGVAPMLHCRFPIRQESDKRKTRSKDDIESNLEELAFKDENGMYLPANNIRMMLIGNQVRQGAAVVLGSFIESKKGTRYRNLCQSCVYVQGLNKSDPEKVYIKPKRKTWDRVFTASYVTSRKTRKVGSRPMITLPWSMAFEVTCFDSNFEPGKLKEIFETGGLRCGLGSWGPRFGRFIIKEWNMKKES